MAHIHNMPYAPNLPYYVSTRSAPKDDTQDTQTIFELRDRNHVIVKTPPSEMAPVCLMEIPVTSLPCDHQKYIVRSSSLPPTFRRFVLDTTGCLMFTMYKTDAAETDPYIPHLLDYLRVIGIGMAGCLKLPFLEDLGIGRKQGLRIILASDVSGFQPLEGPGRFNLGKLFAEKLLGTSAPFSNFTPTVEYICNILNYSSRTTSPYKVKVAVPSYELVPTAATDNRLGGWGEWTISSAKCPYSQEDVKAENSKERVLVAARWKGTSKPVFEPGKPSPVRVIRKYFIVFQE